MTKPPSPRADALRAQREARYGHLQATAAEQIVHTPQPGSPIPYAGKGKTTHESLCGAKNAKGPHKPPRKRRKLKRKIA